MSQWKLEAASVVTVLTDTQAAQEDLTAAITEKLLGEIFDGLMWGGGITQAVPTALSEVLSEQQVVNLQNIGNHIAAGIVGVGNAAQQLQQGNEDMAGTFQSQMLTAADTGDFSYFEQHGQGGR